MAITTRDALIAALAAGQKKDFFKPSQTSEGAGTWSSLWRGAGIPPAGAIPPVYTAGAGYAPDDSTLGAFPFTNNLQSYLLQLQATGATVGKLIVYDRLWACSGMTLNASGTLTVTTPGSLPRGDSLTGAGVEAWGEIYSAPGATGATWTLNYLNQDGNAGASNYTHPANAETVGQMFPWVRANGDTGIRSVVDVYKSAASGALGDLGITLLRRIAEVPFTLANVGDIFDAFYLGMPQIYDDACLAFMVHCSTTNTGLMIGYFTIGQG